MRALLLFLALSLCLVWSPAVRADGASEASAFANELGTKALAILTNKSVPREERRSELEKLFEQNVDIEWIGKFVLGRFWRDASALQKQLYLAHYHTFILTHYTSNLADFTEANFEVTRVHPDDNGGFVVTVLLKRPKAENTVVDYVVRHKDGDGLKVYDILVEGVSMITTQRSEFSSVVSQKGLDYLIAQLESRSKSDTSTKPLVGDGSHTGLRH